MSIRKEIFVTQKRLDVTINITCGTDLIPLEFVVVDFALPENATAVAYAVGKSGESKKLICEIEGNTITFTPKAGFFEAGTNALQLRVTSDNKNLFSYKCGVQCQGSIASDDAKEVEENPSVLTQVLSKLGDVENMITYDESTKTLNICSGGGITSEELINLSDYVISKDVDKIVFNGYELDFTQYAQKDYVLDVAAKLSSDGITFVDSVDAMTDAKKVYALTNTGEIWAYIKHSAKTGDFPNFTNQIPISTDADGDIVGLLENYRYNSSDTLVEQDGTCATGFIPVSSGDTIYFENIQFRNETINSVPPGSYYLRLYDSSFNQLVGFSAYIFSVDANLTTYGYVKGSQTIDDEGNLASIQIGDTRLNGEGFIRMAFVPVEGKEAIITVNEEISYTHAESGVYYEWGWTGRTYPSTEYEDRIVELERDNTATQEQISVNNNNIISLNKRIKVIEDGASVTIPDYWKEAVDVQEDKMKSYQDEGGADTLQFILASDIHGVNGYTNSNGAGTSVTKNIGYVAQYACDKYNIPFVLFSGDIMSQASHSAVSSVYNEYTLLETILGVIDKDKLLITKGNHDGAWGAPVDGVYYLNNIGSKEIYNHLYRRQSLDRQRVFGGNGTYFYVDYMNWRIIMLNCQTDGDGSVGSDGYPVYNAFKHCVFGTEQLAWLSDAALNVPDGMKVIVSAHQPISYAKDGSLLAGILEAFNKRTAYSGSVDVNGDYWGNGVTDTTYKISSVNADFTKTEGKVVAYFHGHIHKDTIDVASYSFPAISITTAGGDVRDSDPVERVQGTATETAMDIVTITPNKIYLTRLGAGYDREISY